ncbi:hypothetical protein [uncultured Mesonia sp.]|uniref:hypothetical protein n=1 Tax=uncultured Mesonia sp. TaxID=399731 RepID=UPI00374FA2D9
MKPYQTAYPLFQQKVNELEVLINRRLCFEKLSTQEVVLLNMQLEIINELKLLLNKKPSISSINFEHLVNDIYKKDSTVHLIHINVLLRPTPDLSRVSRVNIPLYQHYSTKETVKNR